MRYARWNLGDVSTGVHREELVKTIVDDLNISPVTAGLLVNRGIQSSDECRRFLYPSLRDLHDPFSLLGMDAAIARVKRALDANETIAVYGDYDVDGLASSALLYGVFSGLGIKTHVYIPDRFDEGYGLNCSAIEKIAGSGATLIITVDCGITAVEEVFYAQSLGIDVIVLDHHRPPAVLPQAKAIVDPWRPECSYPFKGLSGCGVAFKLIHAMILEGVLRSETPPCKDPVSAFGNYLDLVALATVADMVPMTGENRILTRFGLDTLQHTARPGVRALLDECGLLSESTVLDEYHVGFLIAPRLNAAGRMGDVSTALRLLTTDDPEEGKSFAERLSSLNTRRQEEEAFVVNDALDILKDEVFERGVGPAVVLSSSKWHPGVIGIAASRLAETVWRPAVLISTGTDLGRGSARSIPGLDIFSALSRCRDFFLRFGGHAQAAGFDIDPGHIHDFKEAFYRVSASCLTDDVLEPRLEVDQEIALSDIDLDMASEIQALAPFGVDNPQPVFMLGGVLCRRARDVGSNGSHLKLDLERGLSAIAFGGSEVYKDIRSGGYMDLAFQVKEGEWGGYRKVDVLVKDIRHHELNVRHSGASLCPGGSSEVRVVDKRGTMTAIEDLYRMIPGQKRPTSTQRDSQHPRYSQSVIYAANLKRGLRLFSCINGLLDRERGRGLSKNPPSFRQVEKKDSPHELKHPSSKVIKEERREPLSGQMTGLLGPSVDGDSRERIMTSFRNGETKILVACGNLPSGVQSLGSCTVMFWDPPLTPQDFYNACAVGGGGGAEQGRGDGHCHETLVSLAYTPSISGHIRCRLIAEAPLRREMVRIFNAVREVEELYFSSRDELERHILKRLGIDFPLRGLRLGLRVLEQVGVVSVNDGNHPDNRIYVKIITKPQSPNGKIRLEESTTYRESLVVRRRLEDWHKLALSGSIEEMKAFIQSA